MSGKKTAKKSTKMIKLSLAEQMEKAFRAMPSKISAQFRTDITALKKTEAAQKASVAKIQATSKMAKKKCIDLQTSLKTKNKPALKKQFMSAKKKLDQITKTITQLTTELMLTQKQVKTLSDKKTQFADLAKQLTQQSKKKTIKPTIKKRSSMKKTMSPTTYQEPLRTTREENITINEESTEVTS